MIVFVDTGVLGLLSSPNDKSEAQKCQQWLYSLLSRGVYVISDEKNIDADVIIAAQCQLFQQENLGQNIVIATTNVKHLSRFLQTQK
ncbi:MAG: hypothetical protein AB4372_14295 [Xenococcus sp. (in: cyanobacteria)]